MNPALPIQPVDKPILCSPYDEPSDHWLYDKETGQASHGGTRRPAGYWYKTDRTGTAQKRLFDEERDDLPLVNRLREDVRRWRESGYRGASSVTRELLAHWTRTDRPRRLFFCQREAVETIIWLAEIAMPGRWSKTGFKNFQVGPEDLALLLDGERPGFDLSQTTVFPALIDRPFEAGLLPLRRLGCKMATGSGKTVVMSMLIAWAFCNRGVNPLSREYPNAVLVCCPNLTVKERLQVLRPERADNYYAEFDIVPAKYRNLLQHGKVLVTNWHAFGEESPHKEGDKTYAVVNKGPELPADFARRVLRELHERMPIMVLNDEGHHCWRPRPLDEEELSADEARELEQEAQEATVWIEGLDRLNNSRNATEGVPYSAGRGKPGIAYCVDLSATPFYIKGSGHSEGRPFPWLVSDFGLVDAIESGIVKIPRMPISDTTGRPEPKYFKLWESIRESLEPAEFLPGKAKKPKPESVWREAQGALQQLADQWVEKFGYLKDAKPGQEHVPPVLIVVCDNTDIAELFYEKISGEHEEDVVTESEVAEAAGDDEEAEPPTAKRGAKKPKTRTVYGGGQLYPEFFGNTANRQHTIRIDSKLLAEAESADQSKGKREAAEELRRVVATVGKRGQPGEHVRCVVSVSMLTEGWDANNVTHILGLRAFGSQLLCEQVVGRGLRRLDYTPDPATGLLTEEYVDVYGIPFSVIPFKGRATDKKAPEDRPKNHVRALPERAGMEMRFPVVEGFAFALRKNLIRCNIDDLETLAIEPNREPTATFVNATLGYQTGNRLAVLPFVEQNREEFYRSTHLQAIKFQIAHLIVSRLSNAQYAGLNSRERVLRLQSRHQLFPQVYRYVDEYVKRKVDSQGAHPCELGLQKYIERIVERLSQRIMPDDEQGEPPLLPVLNRYKPIGTTAEVDFKTVRRCHPTWHSHIDQVVLDTETWESSTAFRLEQHASRKLIKWYARNDHLGLMIPYEYQNVDHSYQPDMLVRLVNDLTLLLEIKGYEDDQTKAKHNGARRWVAAVNNWGREGKWGFHVCRNPNLLEQEIMHLLRVATGGSLEG